MGDGTTQDRAPLWYFQKRVSKYGR
jgi:hypothetical protein